MFVEGCRGCRGVSRAMELYRVVEGVGGITMRSVIFSTGALAESMQASKSNRT